MIYRTCLLALCALLCVSSSVNAFYLPGVVPRDYSEGEPVDLRVNKLDSVLTQLPHDYYDLPFCAPAQVDVSAENLGEILTGDRIETSAYDIGAKVSENCKVLCQRTYTDKELALFAERIRERYNVNWIIDNIPATTKHYVESGVYYEKGFPLGFIGNKNRIGSKSKVAYVNNHVAIKMFYHEPEGEEDTGAMKIVGFEVEPFSVAHEVINNNYKDLDASKISTCNHQQHTSRDLRSQAVEGTDVLLDERKSIVWTYDVAWERSDIKWASRWDAYLQMTNPEIHWFSIVNSLVIVLFLTGFVAMIMVRTLRRDLDTYNNQNLSVEEQQEETGWKLIHGDVFRPPEHGGLLAVFLGSGVQIFLMAVSTLLFALLGFLSPANRGGLMSALLILFVFMGLFAGYASTRMYTMFHLPNWKTNTLYTSLFYPGIVFAVFFILNLVIWGEESSGAVPFTTLVALLVLWFGVSVPLVYMGANIAVKKPPTEPACKVNSIPRKVLEDKDWFNQSEFSILVGGILPFAAAFIEIFFIMSSVWLHQFYYVFGFLFIVFVILVLTCAEISIVMCYFQLIHENHHWWWRAFFTSGSSALYLFLYSAFYFIRKLEVVGTSAAILFFGYMLLASLTFMLLTGTVGFFATYLFVNKIYGSLKID